MRLPLIFIDRGVKINGEYYKTEILEKYLLPATRILYGYLIEEYFCFQQDGAPSHKANSVHQWCYENLPDFILKADWLPSSPDLNPLDFSIRGYMLLPDFK
jgi:hypothetical protein